MRKATAFVPAHISGFFQPCEAKMPERTGSRNCGPCLELGVLTQADAEPANRTSVKVFIDGKRAPEAETTVTAVKHLLSMARGSFKVKVHHSCQVPVGAGYGASGAGALGATLALSKALGLYLARDKLTAIAHVAEVKCRTGLGDVGAQAFGGLVIGVQPGAPPHGRWKRILVPRDLKILCATLGPLSTRDLLRDEDFKRRAVKLGECAMNTLTEKPTPAQFVNVSREFAEGLGLLDRELQELIRVALEAGAIGASQAMIGRSVFALARGSNVESVKKKFLDELENVMVSKIDLKGSRFVNV